MGIFDKYEIKTSLGLLGFVIWGVVSIILIPMLIGLGPLGGFEKEAILQKFWFYAGPGMGFLIGIIAISIASFIIFKEKDKEINGVYIHNPEKGVFSFMSKYLTPLNLILGSLLVFGTIGIFSTVTQTFFTEIPMIEQQFTETAEVMFSVYPPSPAETFGLIFVVMLSLFSLGLFYKKNNTPKGSFVYVSIPITIIVSVLYGVINHTLRYSSSDLSMLVVMVFWGFMGLMLILFGSLIPLLLFHDINNLFSKLNKMFSSDKVVYVTIGVLVFIFIIFIMRIIFKKRKKNVGNEIKV